MEKNSPPVIAPINDQFVDEGSTLSFTATATDPDMPGQSLAYSLVEGATPVPNGASINPTTGEFSFTPTELQGGEIYEFNIRVTDNGSPSLYADASITVVVNEVNAWPLLSNIGSDYFVDEGSTLTFTPTVTDPDLPADALTFALIGAPDGASIDPVTGVFTFTPTEDQGPATYFFSVRVTDNGSPNLSDEVGISVTVTEPVNFPPVSTISGPEFGVRGQPLKYLLTAEDSEPANMDAGFRFTIDWGDGTPIQEIDATPGNGAGVSVEHAFPDEGDFKVHVTAIDQDGLAGEAAAHSVAVVRAAIQEDPLHTGELMLVVGGSPSDDVINLRRGARQKDVVVRIDGVKEGVYQPTSRVVVYGGDGNDRVTMVSGVKLPAWLDGGIGDDDLTGGGGPAVILGGEGDDVVSGRGARDLLIGGLGTDLIEGRGGDDLLISGTTTYDGDEQALSAIQAEWLSSRTYESRLANLRGDTTNADFASRLNGEIYLLSEGDITNTSVFDDAAVDFLRGKLGRDVFFGNLDVGVLDSIVQPATNELRIDVD